MTTVCWTRGGLTKGVAVTHLGPPAAHEMHLVFGHSGHLGVPASHKLRVFVNLVRLHVVENNRVNILATSKDLGKAALDVLVELAALGRAVDERGQCSALLLAALLLTGASFFCKGGR